MQEGGRSDVQGCLGRLRIYLNLDSEFLSRHRATLQNSLPRIRWKGRLLPVVVAIGMTFLPPAFSQSSDPGEAAQSPGDTEKESFKVNPLTGQVSASGSNYKPLTAHQRWRLYFKQNYWSVGAYFGPVASALLFDQATGNPKEWGGGLGGYGRRLGSRLGNSTIQGTFQAGVAALLGEDTRYILSDRHTFKGRAGHAVLFGFMTYNNQGHKTLNVANLGGYFAASATSTLWLPGQRNVALYTLTDGCQQAGLGALVNLVQEFWPEIRRSVLRKS